MSALVKIEQNKQLLTTALSSNTKLITDRLPTDAERQDFKENFLELAENNYLIEKVDAKHILTFALNVSKLGIRINPIFKEAYIIPFNVKDKGMMPTLIMPKQGIRQIAYDAGFFLDVDRVYNLNGIIVAQSEMNREQLSSLETTNSQWVDDHFEGFNINLTDLVKSDKMLPVQSVFVGAEYVKTVTKQMQGDQFKIQTWEHKACRRAFNEFFIPRTRKNIVLDEVEKLNDAQVFDADAVPAENENEDIEKALFDNDAVDAEIVEEEVIEVTVKGIMTYYVQNKDTDKGEAIKKIMVQKSDWKKYDTEKLTELYKELVACE